MKRLTELLRRLPEYQSLLHALDGGVSPVAASGFTGASRAFLAAGLRRDLAAPLVLLCADDAEAQRLSSDLEALTGEEAAILPARDFIFHPGTASHQWEHRRLGLFHALLEDQIPLLIVTVEALLQRTIPPDRFRSACLSLDPTGSYSLPDLAEQLTAMGYVRCEQVEGVGQYALRGGILDVFSPSQEAPLRVEFWGDTVDSMGFFDPATQRRTRNAGTVTLLPAGEVLSSEPGGIIGPPDRSLSQVYPELSTAADYLPPHALLLACETPRLSERARSYLWQLEEDVKTLLEEGVLEGAHCILARSFEQLFARLSAWPLVFLDSFATSHYPLPPRHLLSLMVKQLPGYGLSLEAAQEDLLDYRREGYSVVVLAGSQRTADQLQARLREQKLRVAVDYGLHDLPESGDILIAVGSLAAGLEFPAGRFAILSEGAAPSAKKRRERSSPPSNRQRLESFSDLTTGDLVVHEHHGVGRFSGLVTMTVDGVDKDYIKLQFAGADVLYVPAVQLDLVSKYIGGGEDTEARRLSKLGGAEWEKSKAKAKKAAKELAKGLIELYAQRQRQPGFAFSSDSPWQKEFEEQFDYEETEDQLRCIREIKRDMERPIPMDRLLCGDVGYGKTEVAFRAVMKCVLDGKQAAILAPTTVLAQQHYLTALQRFSQFPVKIEMISRSRSAAQSRDILRRTAEGSVDLLIGTHKLLGKGMAFRDLGLLVVDEEQRFGVTHKERLKELSRQVDVLVLSATPIPRTLNMALSGLRDMSTLEEPPQNRRPVQTYVMEHDWGLIADAMTRELERGGQVYYLHNRVESIDSCAARIRNLLPDARLAVAHGRMDQEDLGEIMREMRDNELDILICTTIIETGVDLPNVNTLIVEDADRLGLAQLHQLRGRVGRSARRASAYMTYRRGKVLTEIAERRLSAIREFAAFGSGFKIAMRDLEIRGAGNLLGPEQSGFLMSVGYDMYLRLLEEAVLEEQGLPVTRPTECAADLSVPASIPDSYIPSPDHRMDLYRRIARIRSEEDADEITDELIDRFGDPPRAVNNLVTIALLRTKASRMGITEIVQKDNLVRLALPNPDFERVSALCSQEKYRQRLLFAAGEKPYLALRLRRGDDVLRLVSMVVEDFGAS
jgi:transcription-repair coupling factor (superfamily II helicase)